MSELHGDGEGKFAAWRAYPKIFAMGHRYLKDLLTKEVIVEEKIDGSQFSFGVSNDGELMCRSKGATINMIAPEKMFMKAVEVAQQKHAAGLLVPGYLYRGEYLSRKEHNTLCYDRTPKDHFIGFDICIGNEVYLSREQKEKEFTRIGFETVPLLFKGIIEDIQKCRQFLELTSVLGGQKIEGFVVKSEILFGIDGKPLMGKFVSELFKEAHTGKWQAEDPGAGDFIEKLGATIKTAQRWQKSRMRLLEIGKLENSPRDIPLLMAEVKKDILEEEADNLKEQLWKYAKDKLLRISTGGLAGWYKEQLLMLQFNREGQDGGKKNE